MASSLSSSARLDCGADSSRPAFETSAGYRGYVLALLVLVNVCGWVDRNVFSILLESIRQELGFSDTQLALLGGTAVGVFYAACGLPIAWLADRTNRRAVLSAATATWSVMTALCGLATGFVTLFLARVGIGVGEAGSTPPAHSLISDYFAPAKRALALGILSLYIPLGFSIGFLGGGWLDELFGWRTAFLVMGLPGVALALIVRLTLREPPRGHAEGFVGSTATPPLWSTLRYFLSRRALRHLPVAGAVHSIGAVASAVWLPAYLIRSHDITTGEAGGWMALAYGVGGAVGVLAGGYFSDRIARRTGEERWYLWWSAAVVLSTVPFVCVVYLSNQLALSVAALVVSTTLGHMFLGPVVAMLQGLAGLRRRAMVSAFYLFLVNLVALGLGPLAVGMASDRFSPALGNDALRYALLSIVTVTCIWSALHFMMAARSLPADMAAARADDAGAVPPRRWHQPGELV